MRKGEMTMKKIIIVTLVAVLIFGAVITTAMFIPAKKVGVELDNNVVYIAFPKMHNRDQGYISHSAKNLIIDKSEHSYVKLLDETYNIKHRTNDVLNYAKYCKIEDYATFEDVCVEIIANGIWGGGSQVSFSIPLNVFPFHEGYDFSTINLERLRIKAEVIARQKGYTTLGAIYLSDTYLSVNAWKINQ